MKPSVMSSIPTYKHAHLHTHTHTHTHTHKLARKHNFRHTYRTYHTHRHAYIHTHTRTLTSRLFFITNNCYSRKTKGIEWNKINFVFNTLRKCLFRVTFVSILYFHWVFWFSSLKRISSSSLKLFCFVHSYTNLINIESYIQENGQSPLRTTRFSC